MIIKPNLYLIFNEIVISENSKVNLLIHMSKERRHADGSDNRIPPTENQYYDPDTHTAPLVFPAATIDKEAVLENTRKLFEIFDINIQEATTLPDSWPGNDYYMKIQPFIVKKSDEFNSLAPKYYPYKRFSWLRGREGAYINFRFALFTEVNRNTVETAYTCAHEAGHLFGLGHQGDVRAPVELKQKDLSYYGPRHNSWAPIMGDYYGKFAQWSNSDYFPSSRNQNDINIMRGYMDLKKEPPKDYEWKTGRRSKPSALPSKRGNSKKTRKHIRYLTENDGTVIEGILGYPFDFDLYAILVRPGQFYAKVAPLNPVITTACSLEIMYCDCQLDLKKYGITKVSYGDFGEVWWPGDSSVPDDRYENYDKIFMDNAEKFVQVKGSNEFVSSYVLEPFDSTTLIILKVAGGWRDPVNEDKQPTTDDIGISQYGALGRYKLQISLPSLIPNNSLTKLEICESFWTCNGEVTLLTTSSSFGGKEDGLHALKQKIITNGEIEEKNFLVYGQPIDINAPNPTFPDGSTKGIYLPVIIDGECKKQEFIVGMSRPE